MLFYDFEAMVPTHYPLIMDYIGVKCFSDFRISGFSD